MVTCDFCVIFLVPFYWSVYKLKPSARWAHGFWAFSVDSARKYTNHIMKFLVVITIINRIFCKICLLLFVHMETLFYKILTCKI